MPQFPSDARPTQKTRRPDRVGRGDHAGSRDDLYTHRRTAYPAPRHPDPGAGRNGQPVGVELELHRQGMSAAGPRRLRRRPGRPTAELGQADRRGGGQSRREGSAVLHPWWEVYQVVSYDLTSRMGDEQAVQGDGHRLP